MKAGLKGPFSYDAKCCPGDCSSNRNKTDLQSSNVDLLCIQPREQFVTMVSAVPPAGVSRNAVFSVALVLPGHWESACV